jgi:hypothetical protein
VGADEPCGDLRSQRSRIAVDTLSRTAAGGPLWFGSVASHVEEVTAGDNIGPAATTRTCI